MMMSQTEGKIIHVLSKSLNEKDQDLVEQALCCLTSLIKNEENDQVEAFPFVPHQALHPLQLAREIASC